MRDGSARNRDLSSPSQPVTLSNDGGGAAEIVSRGATIRALCVPDRDNRVDDVVLGFDTLAEYRADRWFLGCVAGRYANRIRDGRFTLDGRTYQLPRNDRGHHLHGGPLGFHAQEWALERADGPDGAAVRCTLVSPAGEQGYPGTVRTEVRYTLTREHALVIDYHAETDAATVLNLTQHAYFDLAGTVGSDVLEHELEIEADHYLPVDASGIPTGEKARVAGTAFDFTRPRRLGEQLAHGHPQIELCGGFDHCFALRGPAGALTRAATLREPRSGRTLEVWTTEPGVQLYTGQFLGPVRGKGGRAYHAFSGLCLETQHFPDSPNRREFPSTVVRPGTPYRSRTIFRFATR